MYQAVIIDDEPFIVEGLVNAIDWSGFHLEIGLASTDPVAALSYILTNPVHLVITDVSMPVLNGLQLIQRIKDAKPTIFVIVLSAYDNFEYARTALRYGAENYLLKPLDPNELSDTLSQILHHIKEREQLNSTYGRAMLTFRNSFTEQWLKNLLPNTELSTRAELLGINLNASDFTAVIFTCSRSQDDTMSHFFDLLLTFLPGHYTGNFFFETPVKLVCVFSSAGENTETMEGFIAAVMSSAAASGLSVFASVGTTVTQFSSVHISCSQADAMTYLEYTALPYVVYEDIPKLAVTADNALSEYDKKSGSSTGAIETLYTLFPPYLCTIHLLSKRIGSICKKEDILSEKFSGLSGYITQIPAPTESLSVFLNFTLNFLAQSNHLLFKMQQSMYPCVDAVIKSVEEFSDKDISLKTLASKLNVSASYLGTVFHQQTGYYFNDYLTEARLKYAAVLLTETDTKIKDIVDQIGFSSQTYFNRSFKRHYQTSPVNYRRDKKVGLLTATSSP